MGGKSQTISVIPELIIFFSFDQVVGQRIFNYQLLMKIPTAQTTTRSNGILKTIEGYISHCQSANGA